MSYRLQQSLSERHCETRSAPSKPDESTPPFSFSTTIYRYAETDCDFVDRRRRVTMHLEGVRYYGYRYLKPVLGRWINRDPIGEDGGDNVYVFVVNRPTQVIDAFGDFGIIPTPSPPGISPPDPTPGKCKCPAGSDKGREPNPKYTPGQDNNGCGGIGGLIGVPIPVPDDPMPWLPGWSVSCPFTSMCNQHDTCYATCNMDRANCDFNFYLDLRNRCSQCADDNFRRWDPRKYLWRRDCYNMARAYYIAVQLLGGNDYDILQDKACLPCCCP